MRISDWSSDVCFPIWPVCRQFAQGDRRDGGGSGESGQRVDLGKRSRGRAEPGLPGIRIGRRERSGAAREADFGPPTWNLAHLAPRSEEHTSELQSLMRISYAVFCLKKKNTNTN